MSDTDKNSHNVRKDSDLAAGIPDKLRKKLPGDFSFSDIGNIDLREAETIANEDILFLSENDLIEGLEDFDLIPLKGMDAGDDGTREDIEATQVRTAVEEDQSFVQPPMTDRLEPDASEHREELDHGDGKKWIPLDEINIDVGEDQRWVPLDEIVVKEIVRPVEREEPAKILQTEDAVREREKRNLADAEESVTLDEVDERPLGEEFSPPEREEPVVEDGDAIWIDFDSDDAPDVAEEKSVYKAEKKTEDTTDVSLQPHVEEEVWEQPVELRTEESGERDADLFEDEDIPPIEVFATKPDEEERPADKKTDVQNLQEDEASYKTPGVGHAAISGIGDEKIYEKTEEVGLSENVIFIDDEGDEERHDSRSIFDESELEKITADLLVYNEGKPKILREAAIDEDREGISAIRDGMSLAYEDLLKEFDEELRYSDEELDFVHSAIMEDDYGTYIREIDEFYGLKKSTGITTAVELLGLTVDEIDTIEDELFGNEYKDVNLYDIFDFFGHEIGKPGDSFPIEKSCTYILSHKDSLHGTEKESIEKDITSSNALIYEESIDEIKDQLHKKLVKKKKVPEKETEAIYDITDKVVILDDDNIDTFVQEFPEHKRVDIKTLLKYLDGLFEKLPENIIKKFAGSEYFDLYLKVLNELGV